MDYKLAKALWDGRFPFKAGYIPEQVVSGEGSPSHIIPPTLSELVEACGEDLGGLEHWPENASGKEKWEALSKRIWVMEVGAKNPQYDTITYGSTPEEAVAKLWLTLNRAPKEKETPPSESTLN